MLATGHEGAPGKRQLREAEDAYLDGAKKLEHDELNAAEAQFQKALKLDPENRTYAMAISVVREHRVAALVQGVSKARQAGDDRRAETLLAEARQIDPQNPLVTEHSGPFVRQPAHVPVTAEELASQAVANSGNEPSEPWRIEAPALAGAIELKPSAGVKSLHLRGSSADVIRRVALDFGIRAIIDESVENKTLRLDLDNVTYPQAMAALMDMADVFAVPVDETSIMVARENSADRDRLERQMVETVNIPGLSPDELNELAQVIRSVFSVQKLSVEPAHGAIVIRAPEDILGPMNQTLKGLMEGAGEVMIEVKLYEMDTTRSTNIGGALPSQFNVFSVDQEANSIVSQNESIVQQAIAQGLIPAGTSNLDIALALIQLGLVQSSLASNLIGVIGGGLTQTGVSAATNFTFNLALNTSDTRMLDDVQMRVGDRQDATFREGEKYPIVTSTYSTGLSTAASSLANQTINGVSLSSLLSQYSGGTSVTIPQVTYEDLGVTLKATPTIQRSGRVGLALDMKIESLSGSSLDGNPVLNSRQFATGLSLGDGESALMVSNVSRSETNALSGFPGLSDLPGFETPTEESVEKDTGQLVVVVTPHIIRRRADLIAGPRIAVPGHQAAN